LNQQGEDEAKIRDYDPELLDIISNFKEYDLRFMTRVEPGRIKGIRELDKLNIEYV
jgi:hypothetical protein